MSIKIKYVKLKNVPRTDNVKISNLLKKNPLSFLDHNIVMRLKEILIQKLSRTFEIMISITLLLLVPKQICLFYKVSLVGWLVRRRIFSTSRSTFAKKILLMLAVAGGWRRCMQM